MSIGLTRGVLIGSVIVLVIIASAFGFIYLQTSSSLNGENNTISSLSDQVSMDQSQISSLQSQLAHPTTVTSTLILLNTVTSTATSVSTVTNTATVTTVSTVVSTSTPSMVNVTRKIQFFIGNTTSSSGASGETIKIYLNSSSWVDTIVTNVNGTAVTHTAFTSGEVLTLSITSPSGTSLTFNVTVPMMSQSDATLLRRNFIVIYVS